jgi:hypothetical protein
VPLVRVPLGEALAQQEQVRVPRILTLCEKPEELEARLRERVQTSVLLEEEELRLVWRLLELAGKFLACALNVGVVSSSVLSSCVLNVGVVSSSVPSNCVLSVWVPSSCVLSVWVLSNCVLSVWVLSNCVLSVWVLSSSVPST